MNYSIVQAITQSKLKAFSLGRTNPVKKANPLSKKKEIEEKKQVYLQQTHMAHVSRIVGNMFLVYLMVGGVKRSGQSF